MTNDASHTADRLHAAALATGPDDARARAAGHARRCADALPSFPDLAATYRLAAEILEDCKTCGICGREADGDEADTEGWTRARFCICREPECPDDVDLCPACSSTP